MSEENSDQEIILDEDNDVSAVVEKVKKLKERLKQCQQAKQDNLAGWQRAQADFINYRRRQEEQMNEWSKMFGEGLIKDLLPVLDTLDASVAQVGVKEKFTSLPVDAEALTGQQPSPSKGEGENPNPPRLTSDPASISLGEAGESERATPLLKGGAGGLDLKGGIDGLKMVREQLMKILSKHGLMEMKSVGEKFNPERHEAVERVEAEGADESTVVEEVQKGYLLSGKVLRVAKVKVSK
ncbi:nucleotide exchange factor GrpE [Patescibacteria group bacterium]|nr:nucleotide exchange factor GrpE [Patescibacteria group bacterium]